MAVHHRGGMRGSWLKLFRVVKGDSLSKSLSTCVYFGSGKVEDERIEKAVREVFSFKPADIISQLNLLRPIYTRTTNYGHFGKVDDLETITWEKTDKAEALKQAVK